MSNATLPEYVGGLPNLCGSEDLIAEAVARTGPVVLPECGINVLPASDADELLPVLGQWNLDGLCSRALPADQPDSGG
jgi:hypothetical protein